MADRKWGTGAKVALGGAVAVGAGWLLWQTVKGIAVASAAVGAGVTMAAAATLAKHGVVVQYPETAPPPGAGTTLTREAGDAAALSALCSDGPGKGKCLFDADRLAEIKRLGFTFWGPPAPATTAVK